MYLLHRLSGQGTNPTGSPAENAGAKQRTEETGNGVLKASRHHADTGKDQAAQANDSAGIHGERFERPHERLSAGEVHGALSMGCGGKSEREEDGSERTNGSH